MRGTLRKETTACKTSSTHNVRTCRASARSTRSPAAAGSSSFFYLGRLFQGPDLRLELRKFLLIPSLRFPVFADFPGTLDSLVLPLITTADDLRALKHRMIRVWREVDIPELISNSHSEFQRFPHVFSHPDAGNAEKRKRQQISTG